MKRLLVGAMVLFLVPPSAMANELKFSRYYSDRSDSLVAIHEGKKELSISRISVGDLEKLLQEMERSSRQVSDLQKLEVLPRQMSDLQKQVKELEGLTRQVSDLQRLIESVQRQVKEMERLPSQISELQNKVENLQRRIP